ncbi:cyclase family protein [Microbacterium sp.]|uniref:cyclase family protein n=1 Tax=Microbacterium sp. TaxID=51671 RepID=UPI002898EEA5|nr:cyclase family protein [Microbacterium sp.]
MRRLDVGVPFEQGGARLIPEERVGQDERMTDEYRAHFDFAIAFANGGGLQGQGFRLDLPRKDMTAEEISGLLVSHLGLALVGEVELRDLRIVAEPHRGSRGVAAPARADRTERVVDLSHPIAEGMVTASGLPAPTITPHLTLASLALDTLVDLPAEVFHLRDAWTSEQRGIRAATLADRELRDTAVLLDTGGSRLLGSPAYGTASPFLAEDAARLLADAGVRLVGIDALGIDDTESGDERPAHSILLAAGVNVVEHLTALDSLPARGARFTAAPPAIRGFGTFPVRAFATVPISH